MHDEQPTPSAGARIALPALRGVVEFTNVSYSAGASGYAPLVALTLRVRDGESVAIIDTEGAVRTIAALLARTIVPDEGVIRVGGADLQTLEPGSASGHLVDLSAGNATLAQDLLALRTADRIVVLSHGQIVQEGRHVDLMKRKGGPYRIFHDRYSAAQ